MRRRGPWIVFLSASLLVAAGSLFVGHYDFPPDEDGRSAIPLLRVPEPETVSVGPLPMQPLQLADVTFRVSFRWLGPAPAREQLDAATRELAVALLPGFTVMPRPEKSWLRKLRRAPLVAAPGLEFVHVTLPESIDLGPNEVGTSDSTHRLASGRKQTGTEPLYFAPELYIVDFHIRGNDMIRQLQSVDAFIIAFADRTGARIKSDERMRQADAAEIRDRRFLRWRNGVPFGPSYVALGEAAARGSIVVSAEEVGPLALPYLYVILPDGVVNRGVRNLIIAALVQRLVENRMPDAPGRVDLDVRAIRHPDMESWATTALPLGASGKLSLAAEEIRAIGGRMVVFRPIGDARAALCEFAGCELSATFAE